MADQEQPPQANNDDVKGQDGSASGSLFKGASVNKRYLWAIPISVIILFFIIVNPATLHLLQTLIKMLNGAALNGAAYFSIGFALVGGFIMLLLALSFLPDYDRARLALMLEMAGAGLGWVLGMFLSPTSQSEQQTFLNAKTAFVGILSGYLLSKLQTVFDKAIADGKLLNLKSLTLVLVFLIPLLLSTAAVYNVRAYQDLSVQISVGSGDIQAATDNGKTEYRIEVSKTAQFIAESRFPNNTAVLWSLDPTTGHGSIDPNTGEYNAPSELPDDRKLDIVATSLGDKTRVSRLPLVLVKTTAKSPVVGASPPAQLPTQQPDKKPRTPVALQRKPRRAG